MLSWVKVSNKTWSLADQSVASAGNFLQILLLAKYMKLEEFGVIVLCISILQFLEGFQSAVTSSPLNVLGAKLKESEYRQFYLNVSIIQLLLSAVLFFITFVIGYLCYEYLNGIEWILILAILLPTYLWYEYFRKSIYATHYISRAFFITLARYTIFFPMLMVGYSEGEDLALSYVFFCLAISLFIASLPGLFVFIKEIFSIKLTILINSLRHTWNDVWGFGKWMLGTSFVRAFGNNGYAWVIAAILGMESLGLYRVAIQLVNVMNPLRQAVVTFLPAQASRALDKNGHKGLMQALRKNFIYFSAPVVFILSALLLMPAELISFVYAEKYDGMGLDIIVVVGSIAFVVNYLMNFFQIYFLSTEKTKKIFANSILGSSVLIFIGVPLIYFYGYVGAPIGQIVAALASIVYLYMLYRRES